MLGMERDELLEAQSHIWNHLFNFINSMSLKCAIQLGILDAIHRHAPNRMPLSLLVSSLQVHPNKAPYIFRLMRLLTHSGFFVLQEEGYTLTNLSRLLLNDNPCTLSPFFLSMLEPTLVEPWKFLSAWFQNDDRTLFETANGMLFWEYVRIKPKDGEVFNAGMASDAKLVVSVLLGKHKGIFEGVGSLVDVGDGTGTMANAIAKAFPQMECTVLDFPHVVAHLKGDRPNLKFVEGDMFEVIHTADALLLKNLEGERMFGMERDELLEAQTHIWNHLFNFINSMSLKCAIQLGIPDAIHHHAPNPMPLSLLVLSLQLHPNKAPFIFRLMRLLTHSGFFVLQEEGYTLTNPSRLLLNDNPCTVSPFFLSMLEPTLMEPWQFLSAWFQTDDRTPFETINGTLFWEYTGIKPKDGEVFNAGMASDAKLVGSVLLGKHKGIFVGVGSLVDVGGGTGTMAKAIAKDFPQIECTVLDLPHVVAHLKGDRPNFKFVEGDMFEFVPRADAVLLKWILHDWNDEECVKILKNCKAAITSNNYKGKVIAIDIVVGNKKEDESIETQLFFDMLMILAGGKERDEKEWAKLIKEAGFSSYKIFPILGVRSLIEIYP